MRAEKIAWKLHSWPVTSSASLSDTKKDMDKKRNVIRQESFLLPSVNPFTHEWRISIIQKVQITFMSITIVPLRLILLLSLLLVTWVMASVLTIGLGSSMKRPVSKWRRTVFQIISLLARLMFFVMGFMWVNVKGKRATSDEARLLVAAPHSTFFDALLWFCTLPMPSAVSRAENVKSAVFGTLAKTMQPLLVSRHDPQSRQKTIQEIQNRATSNNDYPQLMMFPEGTCTNRKALITFKAGAFIPGAPVQPVLIRYPNDFDTCTWTMNGPGAFSLLWVTMCQFYTRFEVEFLPVYYPNEEEIASPKKYAENVRRLMACSLQIPCTDHTFEDCRLMYHARSNDLPMEAGLIEFSKLSKKLGMDIDGMRELLDEFSAISKSCKEGLMGIEEFSHHLNLPITDELKELFHLYDRDGSGFLDFREYVIGMSLVSQAAATEKTVKLAFEVFDKNGDGLVSRDELDHVLKSVFGHDFETGCMYDRIDIKAEGGIDFEQFYSFVKKRPEYARLFISYAELEQDQIPKERASSSAGIGFSTSGSSDCGGYGISRRHKSLHTDKID